MQPLAWQRPDEARRQRVRDKLKTGPARTQGRAPRCNGALPPARWPAGELSVIIRILSLHWTYTCISTRHRVRRIEVVRRVRFMAPSIGRRRWVDNPAAARLEKIADLPGDLHRGEASADDEDARPLGWPSPIRRRGASAPPRPPAVPTCLRAVRCAGPNV